MPPRKTASKASASAKQTASASKATPATTEPAPSTKRASNRRRGQDPAEDEAEEESVPDNDEEQVDPPTTGNGNAKKPFESFFPALDLGTYLQQLDKWPLARLKKALAQAKHPRRNRPPPEVTAAAAGLIRDREKVVIMLALIGGCREGLIRKVL